MKHWKPITLVIWIIGITLLLVFYIIPHEERMQNSTLKQLKHQNDSLIGENKTLDNAIRQLKQDAQHLEKEIYRSQYIIKALKTRHHEALDSITVMSARDLQEYFSEFKTNGQEF